MFDLEQSITEWRKQMLTTGIKLESLDEFESHLREEIEQQTKSGWSEAEAFKATVRSIGQACALQSEFNKVNSEYSMPRTIGLIIGWLVAAFTLLVGMEYWDMCWNFLKFQPKLDLGTTTAIALVFVAESGMWFLAKASRDKVSRIISFLIYLFLAGVAVYFYYDNTHIRGIFGGWRTVPFCYLWSMPTLFFLPTLFGVWWLRLHITRNHYPPARAKVIH